MSRMKCRIKDNIDIDEFAEETFGINEIHYCKIDINKILSEIGRNTFTYTHFKPHIWNDEDEYIVYLDIPHARAIGYTTNQFNEFFQICE